MTIEPTADRPTDAEPAPSTPTEGSTEASAEASQPKVTRARVKTSGAAPRGRPKSGSSSASKSAPKSGAASAPSTLKPASALVPVPMAVSDTSTVRADRIEISQGGADRVEATSVSVVKGGIGSADASTIDVQQGGIGQANATDIAVSQGGIGFARGERVSIEMGAVGAAFGDDVRVTQAMSGIVAAQGEAVVDQSFVSTLIADRVTMRQPSGVLLLIARQVDGSVRPLLDWRGALAAGAVAGLVIGLLRLVRR